MKSWGERGGGGDWIGSALVCEGSGVTDCSPRPGWCLIIMAANVFVCAERMCLAASCSLLALVAADWVLG